MTDNLIHVWSKCHGCDAQPIVGVRYTCQVCPAGQDNDLCEACYRKFEQGHLKHPMPNAREAPPGTTKHVFAPYEGDARENYLHLLNVPLPSAAPPATPNRFVVRPEFCSGVDSYFGAYAFVVTAEDGGTPLLITALHIMDDLARSKGIDCTYKNKAYNGHELPPLVSGVNLYDVYAQNWMMTDLGAASQMFVLPNAGLDEEPYSQRDIAAFRVAAAAPVTPARLAASMPAVGDPIYLSVNNGTRDRLVPAVVVEITDRTFIFRFTPNAMFPPYTSGAPLLNRAGEVIGINVGGGRLDGHKIGHANHVASIRQHLGWKRI